MASRNGLHKLSIVIFWIIKNLLELNKVSKLYRWLITKERKLVNIFGNLKLEGSSYQAPFIFHNDPHKKRPGLKTKSKLVFLRNFWIILFTSKFLECIGYISGYLPKLKMPENSFWCQYLSHFSIKIVLRRYFIIWPVFNVRPLGFQTTRQFPPPGGGSQRRSDFYNSNLFQS